MIKTKRRQNDKKNGRRGTRERIRDKRETEKEEL